MTHEDKIRITRSVVRRRFRVFLLDCPEDAEQEITVCVLLYDSEDMGKYLRDVGKHFTAVMKAYGYFRRWDRIKSRNDSYTKREVMSNETDFDALESE